MPRSETRLVLPDTALGRNQRRKDDWSLIFLQKCKEATGKDAIRRLLVGSERAGRRPGTGRRMSLVGGVGAGHHEIKALISKLNAQAA